MIRLKIIRGYRADARFWETTGKFLGWIPRQPVPSPYEYSATHPVYQWQGRHIIHVETAHRRYEVFDVSGMTIYRKEKQCHGKEVRPCS